MHILVRFDILHQPGKYLHIAVDRNINSSQVIIDGGFSEQQKGNDGVYI